MEGFAAIPSRRFLRLAWQVLLAASVTLVVLGQPAGSAAPGDAAGSGRLYVIDISGTIDLGLAPYLERVLSDAVAADAAVVVLRIDTPGGRLDAVLQMRDSLIDNPSVPWRS